MYTFKASTHHVRGWAANKYSLSNCAFRRGHGYSYSYIRGPVNVIAINIFSEAELLAPKKAGYFCYLPKFEYGMVTLEWSLWTGGKYVLTFKESIATGWNN